MPERPTPDSVATPEVLVVAVPTAVPLTLKDTVLPETPVPPDVRVADKLLVPPYVPLAAAGESVVLAEDVTVTVSVPVLTACVVLPE